MQPLRAREPAAEREQDGQGEQEPPPSLARLERARPQEEEDEHDPAGVERPQVRGMVVVVLVAGEPGFAGEVGPSERERRHLLQEPRRRERSARGEEVRERGQAARRGRIDLPGGRDLRRGQRDPERERGGAAGQRASPLTARARDRPRQAEAEAHQRDHRLAGQDLQSGHEGELGDGAPHALRTDRRRRPGAGHTRRRRHHPRRQGQRERAVEEAPGGDVHAGEGEGGRRHLRGPARRPFRARPAPRSGVGEQGGQREPQAERGRQRQHEEREHVREERPEVRVAGQGLAERRVRAEEWERSRAHLLDGGRLGGEVGHDRVLVRHHPPARSQGQQRRQEQRAQEPDTTRHSAREAIAASSRR